MKYLLILIVSFLSSSVFTQFSFNINSTNATCFGNVDGTLSCQSITVSGQTPYTVKLFSFSSLMDSIQYNGPINYFASLSGGIYVFYVEDNIGQIYSDTITITEPYILTNTTNVIPATGGLSNGSLTINAVGGTPPYLYSIDGSNWQTSNTFTGLASGYYDAYAQDQNGCQSTQWTAQVGQDPSCNNQLAINSSSNPMCYESCNGEVEIAYLVQNDDEPAWLWREHNGTFVDSVQLPDTNGVYSYSDLCEGVYKFVIGSTSTCQIHEVLALEDPAEITYDSVLVSEPNSPANDGAIEIYGVEGGTGVIQIQFFDTLGIYSSNSNPAINLSPTYYNFYLEDENGCRIYGDGFTLNSTLEIKKVKQNSYSLFPNPTKDILNLQYPTQFKYELVDLLGKRIQIGEGATKVQLSLKNLGKGVYFMKLQSGENAETKRVVVE